MTQIQDDDLSRNQKRLAYYKMLLQKPGNENCSVIAKWVSIYSERIQKLALENPVLHDLADSGLRVDLLNDLAEEIPAYLEAGL